MTEATGHLVTEGYDMDDVETSDNPAASYVTSNTGVEADAVATTAFLKTR
jgi:hypothetical protein